MDKPLSPGLEPVEVVKIDHRGLRIAFPLKIRFTQSHNDTNSKEESSDFPDFQILFIYPALINHGRFQLVLILFSP